MIHFNLVRAPRQGCDLYMYSIGGGAGFEPVVLTVKLVCVLQELSTLRQMFSCWPSLPAPPYPISGPWSHGARR